VPNSISFFKLFQILQTPELPPENHNVLSFSLLSFAWLKVIKNHKLKIFTNELCNYFSQIMIIYNYYSQIIIIFHLSGDFGLTMPAVSVETVPL